MTDPGNSFQTAQRIFPGRTQTTLPRDSVQFGDEDFYTFNTVNTTGRSSLRIVLSGLNADANIELYRQGAGLTTPQLYTDPNGILAVSRNTGTLPETINAELEAGTYFIRVLPGDATDPNDIPGSTPSTNYDLAIALDNGLRSDVLLRDFSTGANVAWRIEGSRVTSSQLLPQLTPPSEWEAQATADFNQDGQGDIVWRNRVSGGNVVWIMNGGSVARSIFFPALADQNWQIGGAGDFNGDGNIDIVWRNYQVGVNSIWLLGAPPTTGDQFPFLGSLVPPAEPNLSARISGVGDFNGDGNPDLLYRNFNPDVGSSVFVDFLSGNQILSRAVLVGPPDNNWEIQGTGDFNGDGQTDIFFRNQVTGFNETWLFNGVERISVVQIGQNPLATQWRAVAPYAGQVPVGLNDLAGNTPATAFALGSLNGNGSFVGTLGSTNTDDYYRFTLGSTSVLSLVLEGVGGGDLSGDLDIQILPGSGGTTPIAESVTDGSAPEAITGQSLAAGTYLIRVFPKAGANSLYRLNLNVNNFPVAVSAGPLFLTEGTTSTISSQLLLVSDANNPPPQLTYSFVDLPDGGDLLSNGEVLLLSSVFTQADINAGRISYRHNGGEAALDQFIFTVRDAGSPQGEVAATTFSIGVLPVNDPPTIDPTAGATLSEGAALTLSNTVLSASDVEQTPAQLIYSLNDLPTNGSLSLNFQALAAGGTFTQADINANRVIYRHNGSETLQDVFSFTLTDNAGGTAIPAPNPFTLTITPVNDAPQVLTNIGLTISEDASASITEALLFTSDAESTPVPGGSDEIVYTIVTGPSRGILEKDGTGPLADGATFTQADIDNDRLVYTNTAEGNSDRFTFTVSDNEGLPATANPLTFNIAVLSSNFVPVLTLNAGVTVSEDDIVTIGSAALGVSDRDNGAAQIIYTVSPTLPTTGTIRRDGTPLAAGQSFTQADVNANRITFRHNGSETPTTDAFRFTIRDILNAGPTEEQVLSISVANRPDAPVLVSNLGLTVSENQQQAFLTQALLLTSDVDSLPGNVIYTLTGTPSAGDLIRGTTTLGTGDTFTQAELNAGNVIRYRNNGSESVSDAFGFTVTDSDGLPNSPTAQIFNISITQVNDGPVVTVGTAPTDFSEGDSLPINATLISASDADGPEPITYTLVNLPTSGQLILNTATLAEGGTFTQSDLDSGALTYVHNGAEPAGGAATSTDRFTFRAADGAGATSAVTGLTLTINEANDAPVITVPGPQTLNEDGTLPFGNGLIAISDPDSDPIDLDLSVGSGTLTVPGADTGSTVEISGSGTNLTTRLGNLVYRPNPNYFGPDTLTITANDGEGGTQTQTISLTVQPSNDPPTLTLPGAQTVLEDEVLTLTIETTDIDAGGSNVSATLQATNGTLSINPSAVVSVTGGANGSNTVTFEGTIDQVAAALTDLEYQGNPDYFGSDQILVSINDQGATGPTPGSVQGTIAVTVTPVNDPPTFTTGSNITINEDPVPAQQVITGWATSISRGAANESNQTLTFEVTAVDTSLFTATGRPRIDPATGNLIFTPAPNAFGTTDVTVRLRDSGSNTAPNDNVSEDFTFQITIDPVNDAPTFNLSSTNITVAEDTPYSAVIATAIRPGPNAAAPFDEANQTVTFVIDSNSNPELFSVAPTLGTDGTLSFTPAQDASGQAILTVRLQDDGGVENGGVDTSILRTVTINVRAVNDAPVISLPTASLTIDEDQQLNISGISISDVDAGTGIIEVTLTALGPGNSTNAGTLNVNGTTGSTVRLTGTLEEINSSLSNFTYLNRLNVSGEERISITVSDRGNTGGPALSDTEILTINIQPVNDAPTLTISNVVRSPLEDTPFTLSGITVSDVDAANGTIQITFSTQQPGGRVFFGNTTGLTEVNGVDLSTGASQIVVQGTLAAFRTTGLPSLRYQAAENYFGTDEVSINVSDLGSVGAGGAQTASGIVSLNVQAVNDPPSLDLPDGPLSIGEDTQLAFTGANAIDLTDVDSGDSPVRITLNVTNGRLTLDQAALNLISGENNSAGAVYEGAIADIINALSTLVYQPNLNFFGSDTLNITVNDQGATGGAAGSGVDVTDSVEINVTEVNDPPTLLRNNRLFVNEGTEDEPILNGLLDATDVDGPTPQFVLVSAPTNGSLAVGTTDLTASGTFTRDDIIGGQLQYTHNGSETTADSFRFRLVGDPANTTFTFNITVNDVNDVPLVTLNNPLTVNENNSGTVIGNLRNLLSVSDPDSTAAQVRYVIEAVPTSGTLNRLGNLTVGSTFTQADINSGAVTYRQNGSEGTNDSFTFRVEDQAGNSTDSIAFNIAITPVNDAPITVSSGPITLSEGSALAISSNQLLTTDPENQTPITYRLLSRPLDGNLILNGTTTLGIGDTFTQANINSGNLAYRHNGSETTSDVFTYEVSDTPLPTGTPLTRTGRFDIVITPVNDRPVLSTTSPRLIIAGSQPSESQIDGTLLLVTDVDNTPDQIRYTLSTAPTVGQLRLNGTALTANGQFTQTDILNGNLTYFYSGAGTPGSDFFRFNVSDGTNTLATTNFNISFTYAT